MKFVTFCVKSSLCYSRLHVTHSQADATEFDVLSLILKFVEILALVKLFSAFCKFQETTKHCLLILSSFHPVWYTERKVIVLKQ